MGQRRSPIALNRHGTGPRLVMERRLAESRNEALSRHGTGPCLTMGPGPFTEWSFVKLRNGAWSGHGARPRATKRLFSHGTRPQVTERMPSQSRNGGLVSKDLESQPEMGPRGSPVPLKSHGTGPGLVMERGLV